MWWPWWPFNPADVYLNSVLPLEQMVREGVIDSRVQLVPVLDGLQPPRFYQWWFAPLTQLPVTSFQIYLNFFYTQILAKIHADMHMKASSQGYLQACIHMH